jgi:hypothetical protein
MLRLAADEDFNNDFVRGVRRRQPAIDFITVQEAGLSGADDPDVLQWAAESNRVLFSHDVSTMTKHAIERVVAGKPMAGLFEASRALPIGKVIEDILIIAECSLEDEWQGQIRYLPLR